MKIGLDFDGVIVDSQQFNRLEDKPNILECHPIKGAREAILWLQRRGHDIYILTARPKDEWVLIEAWLKKREFPVMRVSNKKERGTTIFLDDRAVRFTNWLDFTKLIY